MEEVLSLLSTFLDEDSNNVPKCLLPLMDTFQDTTEKRLVRWIPYHMLAILMGIREEANGSLKCFETIGKMFHGFMDAKGRLVVVEGPRRLPNLIQWSSCNLIVEIMVDRRYPETVQLAAPKVLGELDTAYKLELVPQISIGVGCEWLDCGQTTHHRCWSRFIPCV